MVELIIGLIIGFFLGAYVFNKKLRDGGSKMLAKGKIAEEKPKAKAKSKGGK